MQAKQLRTCHWGGILPCQEVMHKSALDAFNRSIPKQTWKDREMIRKPPRDLFAKKDRTRLTLYVIHTRPGDHFSTDAEYRKAHLNYLFELDQAGLLVGAGPLLDRDGDYYEGEGLIVLRADDAAHAGAIADQDPFHRNAVRRYTLQPWLLSEGIAFEHLMQSKR